jgi:serralysin
MPASPHDESYVNSLFWGYRWDTLNAYNNLLPATYAVQLFFPRHAEDAYPVQATIDLDLQPPPGFQSFFGAYETQIRKVASWVSSVATISFTSHASNDPDPPHPDPGLPSIYLFVENLGGPNGAASTPVGLEGPGDYFVSLLRIHPARINQDYPVHEREPFTNYVLTHEFLHALGLKHPFASVADVGPYPPGGTQDETNPSIVYTQLDYNPAKALADVDGDGTIGAETLYTHHLGAFDVAALQQLYGANYTTNSGDTVYRFEEGAARWLYEISINGADSPWDGFIPVFTIWDGGGRDTYDFSAIRHGVVADLRPGHYSDFVNGVLLDVPGNMANAFLFQGDYASLIENLTGTESDDWLSGNIGSNTIHGLGDDDLIFGWESVDFLFGGDGDDIIDGGPGADLIDGGPGNNTASHANAAARVLVDLLAPHTNAGEATGDTPTNIQNLNGSRFNDILYGNADVNRFGGGGGSDVMVGKAGGDRFDGGAGLATVSFDGSGAVTASLKTRSLNRGDALGDTYISIENLTGGSFHDRLYGNDAANRLRGGAPSAGVDHDRLFGFGGADQLFGYKGNDWLTGGLGADRLEGGLGMDRFIFTTVADSRVSTGRDKILDFNRTQGDRIWLNEIDANSTIAGNQAFKFIGSAAFAGIAGQLRFQKIGADTHILGDINGDRIADLAIISDRAIAFVAKDFVL